MSVEPDAGRLLAAALLALLAATAGCAAQGLGSPDTSIRFENVTADAGVAYATDGGGAGNGDDGVFVADVNRDGWRDFLVIGGDRPALFRNANGSFRRSDALPALSDSFKSALFFDRDGDGWQDLLLLRERATPVFLENRRGSFERADVGLGNLTYPMGATAADYDRDGDRDLLIYQSGDWSEGKPEGYFSLHGHVADDDGYPNVLYENVGDGFERVDDAGFTATRWSLTASFVDVNGDDYPDVYVANDYNNDTLYLNRGDGTFDERLLPGATARNGMATEIGDFDGDGRMDVFTTNIELPITPSTVSRERYERLEQLAGFVIKSGRTEGNTLLLNDGTGNFTDAAPAYGVRVGGWGWAATHTDFDLDGDRDLLHATQHVVAIDRQEPHFTYPMVWEREGDEFTNLDASERGLNETDGRGLATLDVDRDGDRDLVIAPYDGTVHVYENVGANANGLSYQVVDGDGSPVYGAEVTVTVGGHSNTDQQTVRSDFLSQESRVTTVGLGTASQADVRVAWPDGTRRTFEDVPANRQVRITKDGLETVATYDG